MDDGRKNSWLSVFIIGGTAALIYDAMTTLPVKLTVEQDAALDAAAKQLGVPKLWLYGIMYLESTLRPSAVNNVTGATGLIQFLPSTALSLGTSVAQLAEMTFEDQLQYVVKYLKSHFPFNSFIDLYLAVFYPAAIKHDNNYQFPDAVAKANPGYAVEGVVTKGGIAEIIASRLFRSGIIV